MWLDKLIRNGVLSQLYVGVCWLRTSVEMKWTHTARRDGVYMFHVWAACKKWNYLRTWDERCPLHTLDAMVRIVQRRWNIQQHIRGIAGGRDVGLVLLLGLFLFHWLDGAILMACHRSNSWATALSGMAIQFFVRRTWIQIRLGGTQQQQHSTSQRDFVPWRTLGYYWEWVPDEISNAA